MRVLVPYDGRDPKTRLSSLFDDAERRTLARLMLEDVIDVLERAGRTPTVLSTAAVDVDCPVILDQAGLSAAVNRLLERECPVAVVMADLPLLNVDAVDALFERDGDVVIAPGLGGGTNALVVRHPEFRVDYHGVSYRDHAARAAEVGAGLSTVPSFRFAVDIDEPDDLVEVLLHGENATADWLEDAGVRISETGSRAVVAREELG